MLISLALAFQATVWTVDDSGGPGVDFTDLPPAIAAASPGDVLLVRAGSYSKPIVNKGLSIHADQGAVVTVAGLRVESIPAGERVTLSGLTSPANGLISSCAGMVWIQGCRFQPPAAGGYALQVLDCVDVVLVDVVGIGGGTAFTSFATPGPGLQTSNSAVHVFECMFQGGNGGWIDPFATLPLGYEPAAGARHESGEFVAHASTFVGGQGLAPKDPYFVVCLPPAVGTGAPGLELLAPGHVRDCQLQGGPGGFALFCPPGPTGPAYSGLAPVVFQGEYVSLDVPSPIREKSAFGLTLSGSPGVFAIVGIAQSQDALLIPAWGGGLVIQGPYLVLPPVVIPAAGTLTQTFGLLDLGPSVESLTFLSQVAAVDAFGAITVNDAAAVVLLDEQF